MPHIFWTRLYPFVILMSVQLLDQFIYIVGNGSNKSSAKRPPLSKQKRRSRGIHCQCILSDSYENLKGSNRVFA